MGSKCVNVKLVGNIDGTDNDHQLVYLLHQCEPSFSKQNALQGVKAIVLGRTLYVTTLQ